MWDGVHSKIGWAVFFFIQIIWILRKWGSRTQKSPSSASLGFSRLLPVAYVPGRPSEIPNTPERSNQGWIEDIWLPITATTVWRKTYGRCSWREHLELHPRTETPSSVIWGPRESQITRSPGGESPSPADTRGCPSSGPWSQVPNSRSHISEKKLGQFSKSQKDSESAQIQEPGSPYHQLPSSLTRKPY